MKNNYVIDCENLNENDIEQFIVYGDKLSEIISNSDNSYASFELCKVLKSSYLTITFVDEDTIHELNKENRDIDSATDVLSFPFIEMREGKLVSAVEIEDFEFDEDGNRVLNLGDVIICLDVAKANAENYGHSIEREVAFLIAHSILHLIGYDHIEEDEEKKMIYLQKLLMNELGLAFDDEQAEITNHKENSSMNALFENIAYPAGSECEHCGYVSILGRPNVGKSTLLNYITGMKVAIVSHKPQTTRTNIRSIYNTDNSQIIFVDTPGVHKASSKLGEIMVGNSLASAKNSDAVLFLADGRFGKPGKVEVELLTRMRGENKKVILAINKSDDVTKESLLPIIMEYSKLYDFTEIIPVSAKTGDNVDVLLDALTKLLPSGPRLFDSEYMTDQTEREISAELIREQLLHFTNQEIPHGVAVEITNFEEKYSDSATDEYDREMVVIKASIICERNSHKGIIIGKNGQMLKRIGSTARINIEKLLGCKVFLELFVKVRDDWKNNDTLLKDYGFVIEDDNPDGI